MYTARFNVLIVHAKFHSDNLKLADIILKTNICIKFLDAV
jgi:hypothetical protein